jgi:hypothetical protein
MMNLDWLFWNCRAKVSNICGDADMDSSYQNYAKVTLSNDPCQESSNDLQG